MDKYRDFARELKATVKNEGDGDTNCDSYVWKVNKSH